MQDDRAGLRLGRFELLRSLGRGGMGEVWLAREEGLERHVAVKLLPSTGQRQAIDRLRREAQALARIRHPHVVPVHEVGEEGGLHYCVMELVDGRSLEGVLAAGPLACTRAAEITRQIAEALTAAHDQGVVHRDVKPANVLLADERDHVTLVDFGVALSALAPTLTATGDLLGTLYYMAPEQARGEAYLADARTDVWGVGATLYEMITGKRAFDGEHPVAVQRAVLERDPIAPRRLRPDCPRDLETIVLRCLEKDPARRYPSARDLGDDLARFLADEPIRARRASPGYLLSKHVRRHRGAWLVGAVTALLAVLGLAIWVRAARAAEREREAGEADELVRVARGFAERGEVAEAWTRLREVELRFPHTPAVIAAYWAMADLTRRDQRDDDVLAQGVWLERLLDAGPSAADAARARWRLGRIYDKLGFLGDARDHYARAIESGALAPAELEDARFGLRWTEWLGRRADAGIGGRVVGAADIDGDGRDEVLVHEPPRSLVALGLRAGRLEVVRRWEMEALEGWARMGEWPRLSVLDVNGDGRLDLLAAAGHCFVAELGDPALRPVVELGECDSVNAADLDGDHRPELVTTRGPLRLYRVARDWSIREIVLDDLAFEENRMNSIELADLDGDGRAEVIYASGAWTRYDVRIAKLEHDALRVIARAQVGTVLGLSATDLDGDGRPEIVAVKAHLYPNPRLFEDDPYLGPSGPMVLRLAGDRLERAWLDPLVPADGPPSELSLVAGGRRTRLGPAFAVRSPAGVLHFYFGRPGASPIRRDLRRLGAANLADGGVAIADLDGDGDAELAFGGARVAAYGVGPPVEGPRRERRRTGADWLSTARELRDADELELALHAYRAAAAHGADPVAVAFEEGVCHARAQRWELALARFREARAGGRGDAALWRAMLEAAEAVADWRTALEAARALGDTARAAAIEKLDASRTVFLQSFAEPWPAWRVEQPLACRGPTADGAIGLSLYPDDRALALPVVWDGSSLEITIELALRDIQYAKSFEIELAQDGGPWIAAGGIEGGGGGGELHLSTYLRTDPVLRPSERQISPQRVDWSVFPERVKLTLSYVEHVAQWQIALHDLGGKQLHQSIVRVASRPPPGSYVVRLGRFGGWFITVSVVDVYQLEIRAAPGAVRALAPVAATPPRRCARDLPAAGASSPLHRAFALASAGRIDDAARELAAWRPSVMARIAPRFFEAGGRDRVTEWEAGLARLALLDESLTSAIVLAGQLMPRRAWGVLLRQIAYQQYVDSGQTRWREGVIALRRAVELAPDDPDAWYMLGYCHFRLGDPAGARGAFERAVALDPELERRYRKQGGPVMLLARIAAREGDAAAAARWLERAVRHGGNLDIARHDRALGALLGDRLGQILGDPQQHLEH